MEALAAATSRCAFSSQKRHSDESTRHTFLVDSLGYLAASFVAIFKTLGDEGLSDLCRLLYYLCRARSFRFKLLVSIY